MFVSIRQVATTFAAILLLMVLTNCRQSPKRNDYLLAFTDTVKGVYGYKNQDGNIVIPPGKYLHCFTDTFRTYAIVAQSKSGFVAIDRGEHILYQVFAYDNGPDYPSNGLFRIVQHNKIGYADATTGKIIIKPQFGCGEQFEDGVAKVSVNCKAQADGEHVSWLSDNWFYINKNGQKVNKPENAD